FVSVLGIKPGGTTDDGMFTFEFCECLGVCDYSPAVLVNDKVFGNLTAASPAEIIADYRKGVLQ
ncbi:MAG: NAD(P)H-dependent oxidoreductase subunit E, partial [Oscillospiraceae bacterium]|nr:NAD(P)H-dependent oxidoreductase subunit E [Oscillospiraceae bacterium]